MALIMPTVAKTVSGTAYQEEIGPMPHKPRKSFMQ